VQDAGSVAGVIGAAILIAALGGAFGWVIGLTMIAREGARVAHWSSAIAGATGLLAILLVIVLPRNHWVFGSQGGGDGFALIGLMIWGAVLVVAAFITFVITEIVRARVARHQKSEEETA
jgi:hypothetical protein